MQTHEAAAQTGQPWTQLQIQTPQELQTLFAALATLVAQESAELRDEAALRAMRDRWQGRKNGILTQIKDNWLAPAPGNWKKELGQGLNALRQQVEQVIEEASARQQSEAVSRRLEAERVDVSLPGRDATPGAPHPVLQVMQEMVEIFVSLGYSIAQGPEMETSYFNFDALNVPESHPARAEQDTFYLQTPGEEQGWLLRTHTSPVQIRTMQRQEPPLRIVVPGRVYRRDAPDATHSPMFHQVEGLAVDRDITFRDLKGTLDEFARRMFGGGTRTRFRPSYFPFTEPSAEVDISCIFCQGKGCRVCKQSGWIELLGCGMVHPALFQHSGYEREAWSGFAFGMGVERTAMLRYGVDDIQRFYSGDLRFLEQFRQ